MSWITPSSRWGYSYENPIFYLSKQPSIPISSSCMSSGNKARIKSLRSIPVSCIIFHTMLNYSVILSRIRGTRSTEITLRRNTHSMYLVCASHTASRDLVIPCLRPFPGSVSHILPMTRAYLIRQAQVYSCTTFPPSYYHYLISQYAHHPFHLHSTCHLLHIDPRLFQPLVRCYQHPYSVLARHPLGHVDQSPASPCSCLLHHKLRYPCDPSGVQLCPPIHIPTQSTHESRYLIPFPSLPPAQSPDAHPSIPHSRDPPAEASPSPRALTSAPRGSLPPVSPALVHAQSTAPVHVASSVGSHPEKKNG
ncbi:MAG: hypothetical protein DHS80DRAFT_25329 [Piptocephalis tieghemiana]|nr:MAG: hypothetical protein DHS80DRAFT_25329 [Piptocephalis tieghemiana]